MLDAINAIVSFINMIISSVVTFITYLGSFFKFLGKAAILLYDLVKWIPPQLQAFAVITIVLSVILLILGRSNNRG